MIEYYSALKKNKIPHYVTPYIKLEDIMRSEISQLPKAKYCMTP